jgi:DNA-binding transcriptional ArsR family regulator
MDTGAEEGLWKALADPTRRRLLDLLRERPRTTGELCAAVGHLSRFAVMKHLTVLEDCGLIVVRRQGRERWNHLNAVPIRQIAERWISPFADLWAASMLALKRQAEATEEEAMTTHTSPEIRTAQIEQEVVIDAARERVFDALTDAGAWWSHRFSNASAAVRLEARPGGRFFEEFDGEEGALYATVTYIKHPESLRLAGPMGMRGAVTGVIHFDLEPQAAGTLVRLSHRVIGEIDAETEAAYSGGWRELLEERLKPYVETGARFQPSATAD